MFNHFYFKQEQYKDLLKEAEKEKLLKEFKEAKKASNKKLNKEDDWSWSNWLLQLSQNLKESKSLSS